MISSDIIRGYNDTIILSILSQGPSYAYDISKTIRESTEGRYVMKETTLYTACARLEKQGLIEIDTNPEGPESRRTYYRITASGQTKLKERIDEWVLTQDVIDRLVMKGRH
jgi:PadR family transcriptional regulator, regulatory protein PadR